MNSSEIRRTETRVALTPEQFAIWIKMQRNLLMSQTRPPTPTLLRAVPAAQNRNYSNFLPNDTFRSTDIYEPPGVVEWYSADYREKPERPIMKVDPIMFDGTLATESWT